MDQIFYESRDKIDEAFREVENIESIKKDPTCYINQHFDLNKKRITWRRQTLIADINKYSDQLIQENESNRSQCLQLSAQTNNIARKIDFLKEELFELKKQFDTFDASVAQLRFERTKNVAIHLKDRLSETLKNYQESLMLNNQLSFGFFDQPIEDIVGKMFDDENLPHRNCERFPGNFTLSGETNQTGGEFNINDLFESETSNRSNSQIKLEPSLAELETIGLLDNPLAHINIEPTNVHMVGIEANRFSKLPTALPKLNQQRQPLLQSKDNNPFITIEGHIYRFKLKYRNDRKYLKCKRRRCAGSVTLSSNGTIVRKSLHTCSGAYKVAEKVFEEIVEYEETGGKYKINGYHYYFRNKLKAQNQSFQCIKSSRNSSEKCPGYIKVTPERIIIRKTGHTCNIAHHQTYSTEMDFHE